MEYRETAHRVLLCLQIILSARYRRLAGNSIVPTQWIISAQMKQTGLYLKAGIIALLFLSTTNISLADQSNRSFLDVKISVIKPFVSDGEELRFVTNLINIGFQKVDVNLTYTITDESNRVIVQRSDTRSIETTLSFVEAIRLPDRMPPGGYILQAHAKYDNLSAYSIDTFAITSPSKEVPIVEISLLGSIIVNGMLLMLFVLKRKQR